MAPPSPPKKREGTGEGARLVRPEGFEPPTYGLEVRCSIQLSYGRISDNSQER
jgi:hypothetical protein